MINDEAKSFTSNFFEKNTPYVPKFDDLLMLSIMFNTKLCWNSLLAKRKLGKSHAVLILISLQVQMVIPYMGFFIIVWDVIKTEVMAVVKEFERFSYLDWRLNCANHITKCDGVVIMNKFGPISFTSGIYKVAIFLNAWMTGQS